MVAGVRGPCSLRHRRVTAGARFASRAPLRGREDRLASRRPAVEHPFVAFCGIWCGKSLSLSLSLAEPGWSVLRCDTRCSETLSGKLRRYPGGSLLQGSILPAPAADARGLSTWSPSLVTGVRSFRGEEVTRRSTEASAIHVSIGLPVLSVLPKSYGRRLPSFALTRRRIARLG